MSFNPGEIDELLGDDSRRLTNEARSQTRIIERIAKELARRGGEDLKLRERLTQFVGDEIRIYLRGSAPYVGGELWGVYQDYITISKPENRFVYVRMSAIAAFEHEYKAAEDNK